MDDNYHERVIAIRNQNKKSMIIPILSIGLLIIIIGVLVWKGNNDIKDPESKSKTELTTLKLNEISNYKTKFVGDNNKVSAIANLLPTPNDYFNQKYISMMTDSKPYGLTIYYEAATGDKYEGEWPIITPDSEIETNSRENALVVFSMIENLDEVTFAYRTSKSTGELDKSKYDTSFTFPRTAFEELYGDLNVLGNDLDLLLNIYNEKPIIDNEKD